MFKYMSGIIALVNKSTIGYFKSVTVDAPLSEEISYLDGPRPNHLVLNQKGLTNAVCAWTCKTPLKSVGATARRRAGATARRHHPNRAEADRRWRGERSEPVKLGVRDHHTRSLCAESPAQTEQWCCWLCRRRIIF
jgi:hypothetical protein